MLGDAAGLAGRDFGLADGVEQRRLAVVDVAHDGDDRCTRRELRRLVGYVEQAFLDVGFRHAVHLWPISSAMSWAVSASITSLIVAIWPCFISRLDDVDRALGHAVGEFLDGDRLRDGDFANELFLRLVGSNALLSRWVRRRKAATERSRTSSALSALITVRRATLLLGTSARRCTRRGGRTCAAPAAGTRRFVFIRLPAYARAPGAAAACVSSPPKRFLATSLGLALGFLVVFAALLLLALARFGGLALGTLDRFAARAPAGLFLGNLALFGFADARSASAWARALRSSSVRVRSTTPEASAGRGRGCVGGARPPARGGLAGRLLGLGCAAGAAHLGFALPAPRRFDLLDHDRLLRPWLKLWRTTPCLARAA